MNLSYLQCFRRSRSALVAVLLAIAPVNGMLADGQRRFASPDDALKALVAASRARDTNALHEIFGPQVHELVSPDLVQASAERESFLSRIAARAALTKKSEDKVILQLGFDGWPFPVPLVRSGGQWFFDTVAGREEILNRRIGRDELNAIQVCRAYVAAQREYASLDRNNDNVPEYAQRLRSTPGAHDGLYWRSTEGEEPSPLGPLIAASAAEGYRGGDQALADARAPYHGYYFKILKRQGSHAPGGRYRYVVNGHMVGGFALVAWPAQWNGTGTMTFIVNQQGQVYQKDLGEKTATLAERLSSYDPDPSWTPVSEP